MLVAGAAAAPQGSVERGRDLDDIYHFIHSLGLAGEPAPAYLPPGTAAAGPVVRFP